MAGVIIAMAGVAIVAIIVAGITGIIAAGITGIIVAGIIGVAVVVAVARCYTGRACLRIRLAVENNVNAFTCVDVSLIMSYDLLNPTFHRSINNVRAGACNVRRWSAR